MRRVLEADIRRIITKALPWILLAVSFIYIAVIEQLNKNSGSDPAYLFLQHAEGSYATACLVLGFAALFGIYADEFSSMVMIGVIGRGVSREKFVLAKFLDLVILTLQLQVLTFLYMLVLKALHGVSFTGLQWKFYILMFVSGSLRTIAFVTIAAIFYFASENAAIGLFAYLAAVLIIPVTVGVVNQMTTLGKYHFERYYMDGMMSAACSNFILGDTGGALLYLILGVSFYIAGALVLTVLVFRKKELEF